MSSSSAEARDLEQNGEGLHCVTFKTRNLAKARDFLRSKNQRPEPDGSESMVLVKDQAFGMVVGFTERRLPNDPR